jgi:hypothetical protein
MCGQVLSQQEERILLKKSQVRGNNKLRYREFTQAVEEITNDVKADPYILVLNLLKIFYKGQDKVSYEGLKEFFGEFVSYFSKEDIVGFLNEVLYIKRGSDEVYF